MNCWRATSSPAPQPGPTGRTRGGRGWRDRDRVRPGFRRTRREEEGAGSLGSRPDELARRQDPYLIQGRLSPLEIVGRGSIAANLDRIRCASWRNRRGRTASSNPCSFREGSAANLCCRALTERGRERRPGSVDNAARVDNAGSRLTPDHAEAAPHCRVCQKKRVAVLSEPFRLGFRA